MARIYPESSRLSAVRRSVCLVLLVWLGSHASFVVAQVVNLDQGRLIMDQQGVLLSVDSGRPLARAIDTLVSEYGYVITYEDPPYECTDDLVDVAAQVRKDHSNYPAGRAPKLLVPRVAHLAVRIIQPSNGRDMAGILDQLIRAQSLSDHGGHFQLVQVGDDFHIVPSEVRDREGNWQRQDSILDTLISLPPMEGTENDMFRAIAEQVTAAKHVKVVSVVDGGVQTGFTSTAQYRLEANNEPAVDVLTRAIAMTGIKRTWLLLYGYDAHAAKSYALNILSVPGTSDLPAGSGLRAPFPRGPTGSSTPAVSPKP